MRCSWPRCPPRGCRWCTWGSWWPAWWLRGWLFYDLSELPPAALAGFLADQVPAAGAGALSWPERILFLRGMRGFRSANLTALTALSDRLADRAAAPGETLWTSGEPAGRLIIPIDGASSWRGPAARRRSARAARWARSRPSPRRPTSTPRRPRRRPATWKAAPTRSSTCSRTTRAWASTSPAPWPAISCARWRSGANWGWTVAQRRAVTKLSSLLLGA